MFYCTQGHFTKPRETQVLVPVEIRPRIYPNGSSGWEIVAEEALCVNHANELGFRKGDVVSRDDLVSQLSWNGGPPYDAATATVSFAEERRRRHLTDGKP